MSRELMKPVKVPDGVIDGLAAQQYFDRLPVDQYTREFVRRRRYSVVHFDGRSVELLPHRTFQQSSDVNRYLGDVVREYEPLEKSLVESPELRALLSLCLSWPPVSPVYGVHQIRVVCNNDMQGHPAPEGVHQDDVHLALIVCIARQNVNGGRTTILSSPEGGSVLYEDILHPGHGILLDDRRVWHYTGPVEPIAGHEGYRDVFVITNDREI